MGYPLKRWREARYLSMVAAVPCWMPWAETWEWECFLAIPNGSIRVSGCWGGCWNFACRLLLGGACLYRLGVGKRKKRATVQNKTTIWDLVQTLGSVCFAYPSIVLYWIQGKRQPHRSGQKQRKKNTLRLRQCEKRKFHASENDPKITSSATADRCCCFLFFFGLHWVGAPSSRTSVASGE